MKSEVENQPVLHGHGRTELLLAAQRDLELCRRARRALEALRKKRAEWERHDVRDGMTLRLRGGRWLWTGAETEFVQAHYRQDLTIPEMRRLLRRSRSAIYQCADRLGLTRKSGSRRPGFVEFVRARNAEGWSDSEISAAWGNVERHSISTVRQRLGLPSNAHSEHVRGRVAVMTREQCATAGVANLGALRAKILSERPVKDGWPAGLSWRAGQILTLLWERGPMTRREIVAALRPDLIGKCTRKAINRALHDNAGCGQDRRNRNSYLGNLLRRGLIVYLGRIVRTGRRSGNRGVYMIAPNVLRGPVTKKQGTTGGTSDAA